MGALAVLLLDFVLRLFHQAAHRFTNLPATPDFQLLHRLLDPFDVGLGLVDMELDTLFEGRISRGPQCLLHASQGLFFGAVCILQLFSEQFSDLVFHGIPPDQRGGLALI